MAKAGKAAKSGKQQADADSARGDVKMAKAPKPDKPVKAKAPSKPAKSNVFSRLARYLTDVRAEMKRVVWPSRQEVINSSGIVITTLVIFIIMIAIFDYVSVTLVRALQGLGG